MLWLHAQGGAQCQGRWCEEVVQKALELGMGGCSPAAADAVLGTQKTLEQLWGSKMFPDSTFYLPFSGLLILRSYLNPHYVFHKNVLAWNLSLPGVHWKPASKISLNLNIFMMPFYSLSVSTVPCSYFCHFFKPFHAFSKSYTFSQAIILKNIICKDIFNFGRITEDEHVW